MLQNSSVPEYQITPPRNKKNEEEVAGGSGALSVSVSVSAGFEEEDRPGLEEAYRNGAGNRWPQQETLALLKIRSEMDAEFKEASAKLPLWEHVSRKMGEVGFNRSATKCKEKFENLYKYHKRTQESGRSNGKVYRFFEQLAALSHPHLEPEKNHSSTPQVATATATATAIQSSSVQNPALSSFVDNSSSTTSSSSRESQGTRKKKRRLTECFQRMMRDVINKQEDLQNKFVEVLEKYEQDRVAREEAWKMQELARIRREREILVQERSIAAAKDAAVLAFLQKYSQQTGTIQFPEQAFALKFPETPPPAGQLPQKPSPVQLPEQPASLQLPEQAPPVQLPVNSMDATHTGKQEKNGDRNPVLIDLDKKESNDGRSYSQTISSRWPKQEVEALIKIRSDFDLQYQESGPKGPLWEEVSTAMEKLGYDRSAKKCKEKWENINKYYRRIKETNKKRPEDSKTCGYVRLLDDLYNRKTGKTDTSNCELKPEELLMHMMGGQQEQHQQQESVAGDGANNNVDQIQGDDENADGYHISSMEDDNPSMAVMS